MVYLAWLIISIGFFVIISGIIAIFRFPDFFTKLHGASVIECAGIPISLVGLALLQSHYTSSLKLLLIAILIFLLNPVTTHALARASMGHKIDSQGRFR
jgi:multicomponent Na+:H+ antiporter subunit G